MRKRIKLVEDWCHAHKFLSVWVFAFVSASPDIYHAIVALGWVDELPGFAKWSLRAIGVIGIVFRLVNQQKLVAKDKDGNNAIS